jgi:signal transduction histidine kinase
MALKTSPQPAIPRTTWQLLTSADEADALFESNRRAFLRMCVVMTGFCVILVTAASLTTAPGLRLMLDAGSGVVMALAFAVAAVVARRKRLRLAAWIASMGMIQPLVWGDLILGSYTEKLYFLACGVVLAGFGLEPRTMWLAYGVMTACLAAQAALINIFFSPEWPLGVAFNPTLVVDVMVLTTGLTVFMHTFVQATKQSQLQARVQLEEAQSERRRAEAAARQAEVASNTKSMFLANVSHELRTPLTAIIGYTELVLEEAHEQGEFGYDHDIQHISNAARHLRTIINDILDLSKIEAGRMELAPVEFMPGELLDELMATMAPLADSNQNTLTLLCADDARHATLHTDHTRLRQILLNLLSNACKFTEHGEVTLTVELDRIKEQDAIRFTVQDTGIGMDEATQARLFEPFVQASMSVGNKHSGTGLGLVITRRILHMLGGDVEVDSAPGQGSTFAAWLPLRSTKRPRTTLPPGSTLH